MAGPLKVLTEADVKILNAMITSWKRDVQDKGGRKSEKLWNPEEDQNTPDVYIALPPPEGIPALDMSESTPGTGDVPGYADCQIYRIIHNYPDDPRIEEVDIEDKRVYNLTTTDIPGDTAWVIIHRTKFGEWVVNGPSSQLKHCRVTECLGDGFYRAKLATAPTFTIPTDVTVGTSTSTIANPSCEPCDLIIGEGPGTSTDPNATVTCGTLQEPTRVVPTGEGDIIIYDPRGLKLKIPGHAIIADMGDTAPNEMTGTGTGTGDVKIYMVITGTYEMVGIPDRFYTCCDNVVTLTQCDTYIVEGMKCEGTPIDCPTTGTASGS